MMIAQRIIVFWVLLTSTGTKGKWFVCLFKALWCNYIGGEGKRSFLEGKKGSQSHAQVLQSSLCMELWPSHTPPVDHSDPSVPRKHRGSPVPAQEFKPIRHGLALPL